LAADSQREGAQLLQKRSRGGALTGPQPLPLNPLGTWPKPLRPQPLNVFLPASGWLQRLVRPIVSFQDQCVSLVKPNTVPAEILGNIP